MSCIGTNRIISYGRRDFNHDTHVPGFRYGTKSASAFLDACSFRAVRADRGDAACGREKPTRTGRSCPRSLRRSARSTRICATAGRGSENVGNKFRRIKRNLSGCARKDVLPCKMMRAVAHDVFSPRENMMYSGDAGIFRGLRPAIIKWVRAKPARNVLRSKTHHFLRSGKHHIPKEYIMRRRRASLGICRAAPERMFCHAK